MPRKKNPVATCAICYESLFDQLDDLDEEIPQVISSCGHAFHEPCIKQWFATQEQRYVDEMRSRQLAWEPPVTAADAPVECPTCRKECMADEETGQVKLQRLYMTWEEKQASSEIGSSPVRHRTVNPTAGDAEVMRLARKARDLGAEVAGLGPEVAEEHLDGVLAKCDGLKQDAVSAKASAAHKKYLGGLTSAINTLRSTIKEYPLASVLRKEIKQAEKRVKTAEAEILRLKDVELPYSIAQAKTEARTAMAKDAKRLAKELQTFKNDLNEERVGNRAKEKEAVARSDQDRKDLALAQLKLGRMEAEKKELEKTVRERVLQIRKYQAKIEARKSLEDENKRLKEEVKNLRELSQPAFGSDDEGDLEPSRRRHAPDFAASTSRPGKRASDAHSTDNSLVVDMPSFQRSALAGSSPLTSLPATSPRKGTLVSAHPTARSYHFDSDDMTASTALLQPRKKSKYFASSSGPAGERQVLDSFDVADDEDDVIDNDGADLRKVVVPPSSPPMEPSAGAIRSRTNPFHTTKQESHAKGKARLETIKATREVIEILDSSTDSDSPLRPANTNVPEAGPSRAVARQKSVSEMLGLTDKYGRPSKGLASGSKVRYRA